MTGFARWILARTPLGTMLRSPTTTKMTWRTTKTSDQSVGARSLRSQETRGWSLDRASRLDAGISPVTHPSRRSA